jgi:cytochrome bd ubiquinol oxidase subunit II
LRSNKNYLVRIVAGAQTTFIIIGWFGAQFPVMVRFNNTNPLTIYNAVAPEKTLMMMILALFVGLALVIPLLLYLLKVFKFSSEISNS